ncbi:GNAT family N-acetyltransferase [Macrococcus carouselicus]|uniref:GNAT family N-acetyltransferase n=1 Tax=Macrococcus carouselicus TaxID=69969 RepID=A0A9Q8CIG2_9STAP|nr:GNAT family N-acetyltransferase [Macrococcus carouselicus]TDM02451.1 GNAT family N-acetyltransferase [Macrococcus carouselicus]
MKLKVNKLQELSSEEILTIIEARINTFIVEQGGHYGDVDQHDRTCLHVSLEEDGQLKAYSRIIEEPDYVRFGRVLVLKEFRKQKLGRKLVGLTLEEIQKRYPGKTIKIIAQAYLKGFYESFGFTATSDVYNHHEIPHIDMEL